MNPRKNKRLESLDNISYKTSKNRVGDLSGAGNILQINEVHVINSQAFAYPHPLHTWLICEPQLGRLVRCISRWWQHQRCCLHNSKEKQAEIKT